ncbi:MAG TPA: CopG family transcriptional regulator [Tissierellaceae bacterium]|nr:CopG family transcriptional regulator [Tissierellaceae bacterium]
MGETNAIVAGIPSNLLGESNGMVPMENKNMSDFVMEALRLFIEEKKRLEVIEKLKKGYIEMSDLNVRLSEMGLEQDNLELALYESSLKRCDLL